MVSIGILALAIAVLPPLSGSRAFAQATPVSESGPAELLTPEQYLSVRPNEVGQVPVFMYHNLVSEDAYRDPSVDPYMYRTYDEFWNDLLWLYENDFYLIGMNDLVSGNFDVPLGKHPVVLTFDDASSMHFSFLNAEAGEIDPNCVVGMLERFHKEHPDFGRGVYFAVVPGNAFSWPEHEQDDLFDQKVQWLMDNDYEIGNHTYTHPILTGLTDDEFAWTIGEPVVWADERIGIDHPANASRVLTLPFGIGPNQMDHPSKYLMMIGGFHYNGYPVNLSGVLELTGGPSSVPWASDWNKYSIPRIPVQDSEMQAVKDMHLGGASPFYTSDGSASTVTVPWPLPEQQWGQFNPNAEKIAGKTIVKYNPETGTPREKKHRLDVLGNVRTAEAPASRAVPMA